MTDNTAIITRALDAHEVELLRRQLREIWPGEWTVLHGQLTRDVQKPPLPGPAEWKDEGDNVTATPVPRFVE
jgi:hypothetical protein